MTEPVACAHGQLARSCNICELESALTAERERAEKAEAALARVLEFVQEYADEPCRYADNCPENAGTRHGRCQPCKARIILATEYPPSVRVLVGQWRPIETAPKDKSVLLFAPYSVMYCGRERYGALGEPSQDSLEWRCDLSGRFANPTHWMSLPSSPITAARKP